MPQGLQDPVTKDPFGDIFPVKQAGAPAPAADPFGDLFPQTDLNDVMQRMQKQQDDIQNTILRLKSVVPRNEGHKQRLDRLVSSLELQLENKHPGRSSLEEFTRGATAGVASGLELPVELAGDALAMNGNKDLQDYVEQNKALINEDTGVGTGAAATGGEIFGGIVASAPFAGGLAEATGKGIVSVFPSSRIAAAIAKGAAGSIWARIATNVITGLPINVLTAFGGPELSTPEDASPEEVQRIKEMNTANKLKQLAIGIGADAFFGAVPPGKKAVAEASTHLSEADKSAADILGENGQITPERQAQLDKVKAQNAVKVAIKRRDKLNKALAQSEWQIQNPDMLWSDVEGTAKRKIYDDFASRQSNSNPNTSVDGLTTNQQMELVALDDHLEKLRGERDEFARVSETDPLLGIGNGRALAKAAIGIDSDPNTSVLYLDVNGLKDINDGMGESVGDQLMKDMRDVIVASHVSQGIVNPSGAANARIFRVRDGGDEFVVAVNHDKAQDLLESIKKNSIRHYGDYVGSISGSIFDTFEESQTLAGKALVKAAKLEDKAKLGIPGRNAEEQRLIDAVKLRQDTEPPPMGAEALAAEKPQAPFPPEVMQAISEVSQAGGLASDESHKAFIEEINRIYGKADIKPEELGRELQALVEDFTPFSVSDAGEIHPPYPDKRLRNDKGEVITPGDHPSGDMQGDNFTVQEQVVNEVENKLGRPLDGKEVTRIHEDIAKVPPDAQDEAYQSAIADIVDTHSGLKDRIAADTLAGKATAAEPAGRTHLESIEHKKPLEAMTEKELGKLDDKLTDALDTVDKKSPEYQVIQRDFDSVHAEYARRNKALDKPAPGEAPLPEGVQRRPEYSDTAIQQTAASAPPKDITPTIIDKALIRLRGMSPRKMSDGEIEVHLRDLETQRRDALPADQESIQKKINKVLEEKTFRAKAIYGDVPQIPGASLQALVGFSYGFSNPGDPDPGKDQSKTDRITNGLMWAGIAATGGLALRMAAKASGRLKTGERMPVPSDKWLGSDVADKKIVNQDDIEVRPKDWMARARDWYQGIVRRSYGMDVAVNQMGGSRLPAAKNPAKLMSMFGRWVSQSEGALMDKPTYTDLAGNVVPLPSLSYREIVDMVQGDLRGLGKLMAARTSIEGEGLRTVPLDPVTADMIFRNAPETYHKAADAMRQFDLSMAQVLEASGVLAPGTKEKFASEEFYAALRRVFDPDAGPPKLSRDNKGNVIVSPNPIKGRTGGNTKQVFNPAETTAAMVPQIYRAAELNNIKNRLVDLWEAAGKPGHLLNQAERRKLPISVDQQMRVDALRHEVNGMGKTDAESIVAAFDPKSLDPRSNVMTVYRDGVLRSYKIDEHIASAMASLHPDELEGLWKVLGLPAGIARKGVVLNPFFVAKQAFIDNWQATLNSQYGFRFGIDQFLGWGNTMLHTKEYQQFLAAGGGHSTLQSHEFSNVKTALQAVKHGGGSPLSVATKQLSEFKLIDAYKTLIVPFSESARVGEYLRARSHGASVLDGVYAAKHVTANFQQRGGFTFMRGLDRASLFLNPAIQGLDQALYRMGANPFRAPEEGRKEAAAKYLTKAFISITLPSMYFWMANKDDQEITDLRKTDTGQKYWFLRSPVDAPKMGLRKGDIVKIPKPIVDGQVFGSSMEATMDKMNQADPSSVDRAVGAMGRDIGFNILPTAGVLYYGLQTNTNMGLGNPIVPPGDENLSPEHQGENRASWAARVVSRKLASVVPDGAPEILKRGTTPAGLDYITSSVGGMLGQDGMLALTQAMAAEEKGYVPAKEELPLVSRVFAGYPSTNVEPIRTFYDRANRVQTVGATMAHLAKEDPSRLATYMASNKEDYVLVGLFSKTQQDIANYRRAIQDVKDMPGDAVSSDDRHLYIKQYTTLMIETARQANLFARQVDQIYARR